MTRCALLPGCVGKPQQVAPGDERLAQDPFVTMLSKGNHRQFLPNFAGELLYFSQIDSLESMQAVPNSVNGSLEGVTVTFHVCTANTWTDSRYPVTYRSDPNHELNTFPAIFLDEQ